MGCYQVAIIAAREALEALEPFFRNDGLREIRMTWRSFQIAIWAKQGDMLRTRNYEVVLKYAYLAADKEVAAARNKQYAKLRAINEYYFSDEFW
jgi:hypothetical protein